MEIGPFELQLKLLKAVFLLVRYFGGCDRHKPVKLDRLSACKFKILKPWAVEVRKRHQS